MDRWFVRMICVTGLLTATPLAQAHPISISRASVYLTRERATVRIEVFLEDLYLFHQLKPNGADFIEVPVIEQGIQLHEQFLRERFEITDVEGSRYEPQSMQAAEVELPAEGVPLADLMAHQLIFELQFQFTTPPEILTFTQRFTDEKDVLPSEMNLRVQQENGGAVVEHTLLPQLPYSLRIDWDNPPLSPEASDRQLAEWAEREKQVLLGITNYGNVYSFLYIENFEVRHEILAPAITLDADLAFARDEDGVLDVAEQEAASHRIAEYFASGNPIIIDSQPIKPVVERCDFYGLDMKDFAQPSKHRPVPLANARVGVILSYRLPSHPQELQMTWDRFNDSLWGVTTVVIAGDDVTRKKLTRVGGRNVLRWQRPETSSVPAPITPVSAQTADVTPNSFTRLGYLIIFASLLCGGLAIARRLPSVWLLAPALIVGVCVSWFALRPRTPELSDADADGLFRQLHANMYQSFERRTEESIYDALAVSVEGELLRKIYLEVRRGLAMEDQGGATARIHDVELVQADRVRDSRRDPRSFCLRCRWNVSGTVEHWGHLHQRTNQYDAEFVVAVADGYWKFVEMELLDEQRLSSETTLRSL
jgi:hypothetical protein